MGKHQLKIALILGSNKWGGGEKHVYDIIAGLQDQFHFTLITKTSPILKKRFSQLKVRHLEWNMSFQSISHLLDHKKQLSWLNQENFHGIHCHLNDASFMLSIYRPALKTVFISSVHGFSSHLYYLLPKHLISVSKAIHNYLLSICQKKSMVIYNGVAQEETMEVAPSKLQAYIFATIHPNKGQEFVCQALQSHSQNTQITFVGTGSNIYQNRLKQMLIETHNPNIEWIPIVGDLKPYYKQASFIIIPSYQEALSYVALEALAYGIPVLAASTGGLKEVFRDDQHGLFFKTGNSGDFYKKLLLMEKKHLQYREHLKKHPFLQENTHFKIEVMCQEIKKIYLRLFESN
ncbi:glycosyltransferase family 4 protein [bacterium]|nr:glycosyltransferase family 4 protein [bacterium]